MAHINTTTYEVVMPRILTPAQIERNKANLRDLTKRSRIAVFNHYGDKCVHCGESIREFLTIDHIIPAHADEKRVGLARRIVKAGFPEGFQILCWNCNFKKSLVDRQIILQANKEAVRFRVKRNEVRLKVIAGYGGKCACCAIDDIKILTLDHTICNGNVERRMFSMNAIYRRVLRDGFPQDYEILCLNCNCGRAISKDKVCPHKHKISSEGY